MPIDTSPEPDRDNRQWWKAQGPLRNKPVKGYPWVRLGSRFLGAAATDDDLPAWARISFAAYARQDENGLASFGPGELEEVAGRVDPNGEIKPLTNPWRDIKKAVQKGWLLPSSTPTCLAVDNLVAEVGNVSRAIPSPVTRARKAA